MTDEQSEGIVVERQNFDEAMKSIKAFAENTKIHEDLGRVPTSGGLFGWGDHKVTGSELNETVSQVEDQLIDIKNFDSGVLDIATDIYKALEALDEEHISGILIAANAAKAASDKATKNVDAIQRIIKVLQNHKDKLDNLEHLMDVDKAWDLLEQQENLIKSISDYKDRLSRLVHLEDVDKLWDSCVDQSKHIKDINKATLEINKILEDQGKLISSLTDAVAAISQKQSDFIETASEKLQAIDSAQTERLKEVGTSVNERLDEIQRNQTNTLSSMTEAQAETLQNMKTAQNDSLDAFERAHSEFVDRVKLEQEKSLKEFNKSLESEKTDLENTVNGLKQKVKMAYIVAGGATAVTVLHLLLSIFEVL